MRKSILLLVGFILLSSSSVKAQKDISQQITSVSMVGVNYSFQLPGADTKTLYGYNSTIGGSFLYKTDKNWLWEANANFITGNQLNIQRTDLFANIATSNGEIISGDGIFTSLALFQRGWHLQGKVGKVIPVFAANPNCGLFVEAGLGYLTNHIRIEVSSYESTPPQIRNDYARGYDKMRGGFACSGEIGYLFLSDSRLLNFSVAFQFVQAFSKSLRDYDFVLMARDDNSYVDRYFGLRLSLFIPIYQRQPKEFYYY